MRLFYLFLFFVDGFSEDVGGPTTETAVVPAPAQRAFTSCVDVAHLRLIQDLAVLVRVRLRKFVDLCYGSFEPALFFKSCLAVANTHPLLVGGPCRYAECTVRSRYLSHSAYPNASSMLIP